MRDTMDIIIDNSASLPIYEQLRNQIRDQIINDVLAYDEQLPSIRVLAKDLSISIMTVKKAYDALEEEGFIVTRQGKGSFVAEKNENVAREIVQKQMEEHMEAVVAIAKDHAIEKEDIMAMLDVLFGGD
ncbi:transcriptional regulator, GntR family [Aedoeadaptatus coxii]|uniref:Transcriptional regulator, GntR family n=2 Tax=Aedoeadaptatus coxii TaxID=755172 RepID=A0A134AF10_9FIRM|nr:transcriptional regulator, GntR family [Peptoniphilus coxii]